MMWIDGEYFQDPLEELKSKKAVAVALKFMEVSQKQIELYAAIQAPIIPPKVGGQVLQINGTGEKGSELVSLPIALSAQDVTMFGEDYMHEGELTDENVYR